MYIYSSILQELCQWAAFLLYTPCVSKPDDRWYGVHYCLFSLLKIIDMGRNMGEKCVKLKAPWE